MALEQCANCENEATMKCSGCVDSPEYQSEDAKDAVYCNRDCQKEHWSNHKTHCRTLSQRKKLLRAAQILKTTLLIYRSILYDIDLTKIEYDDDDETLYLHQRVRSPIVRAKRGPFPEHLTTNAEHREAALANNQCTAAMALLGPLTRKLLGGVASTIGVMDLHVGKPRTRTKLVPGPESSGCPHTVLKVTARSSKEVWIIDVAGCQYGFREVLVPYGKYFADRSCQITSQPTTYDVTETTDLDFFATLSVLNKTKAQREDLRLERRARIHFAEFVQTHGGKDILGGTATEFKEKSDAFARDLKLHILKLDGKVLGTTWLWSSRLKIGGECQR